MRDLLKAGLVVWPISVVFALMFLLFARLDYEESFVRNKEDIKIGLYIVLFAVILGWAIPLLGVGIIILIICAIPVLLIWGLVSSIIEVLKK